MEINKKIVAYLKEKGINNSLLVKKTGISKQNLSRLLNADDIKLSQLIEITNALNLPITYFFDGKENVQSEEVEGYKKTIADLKEEVEEKATTIKGQTFFLIELAKAVSIIKKEKGYNEKNIPGNLTKLLDQIEFGGAILGILDKFEPLKPEDKKFNPK